MNGQRPGTPPTPGKGGLIAIFSGAGILLSLYLWLQFSSVLNGEGFVGGNPFGVAVTAVMELFKGTFDMTTSHIIVGVLLGALLLGAGFAVFFWLLLRTPKTETHRKAKLLGDGKQLAPAAHGTKAANGRLTSGETKSLFLVETFKGKEERHVGFRDTCVIEMGPGAGKTTGIAVPLAYDAPGVCFVTSNKRDIADALLGSRPFPVFLFDPQRICSKDKPTWWWNPLRYVTDEVKAHKLAKIWVDASTAPNAKKDAYFDTAGPNLLAGLLLAAALEDRKISDVFLWLQRTNDNTPIEILEKHKFFLPAASLYGIYHAADEQRSGVFGTASEMVAFLNNSRVRKWIEDDGSDRPEFSPEDFVRSGNHTMISLSKEGIGSTGPLTAGLTIAVLDAAEEMADEHEHGRLPVPLFLILDEAANVCRLRDLPSLYSHYGSRGIIPFTIIQNWAQGCQAWTEDGMRQLWGAATIRIVGAGQADVKHLKEVSELLGKSWVKEYSVNHSGAKNGGYSRGTTQKEQDIMTVDDLAAMEVGECVVSIAGGRAFLGRTRPWMDRPEMAPAIYASIAEHEPHTAVSVA